MKNKIINRINYVRQLEEGLDFLLKKNCNELTRPYWKRRNKILIKWYLNELDKYKD